MSVLYPLAIVDETSIMTQVQMTLQYYHSINVLYAQAETNEGEVVLEGNARNATEKDLINRLMSNLHGVQSVKNRMAIEGA
jgi:osmotically-inducible protein OsmY